ncbi:unnamed protein product [Effrenium voratum]|nr:unnamed protein product [Effrenium voratum]
MAARMLAPKAPNRSWELERGEVQWLVWQLCHRQALLSVEPSKDELEEWWWKCQTFRVSALISAIEQQLESSWNGHSWAHCQQKTGPDIRPGQHDWRPPFRALHLLEHLRTKPCAAEVTKVSLRKLQPLLAFLQGELPQFYGVTTRLLFFEPGPSRSQKKLAVDEPVPSERPPAQEENSPSSTAPGEDTSEADSDSPPQSEDPLPRIPQSQIPLCISRICAKPL